MQVHDLALQVSTLRDSIASATLYESEHLYMLLMDIVMHGYGITVLHVQAVHTLLSSPLTLPHYTYYKQKPCMHQLTMSTYFRQPTHFLFSLYKRTQCWSYYSVYHIKYNKEDLKTRIMEYSKMEKFQKSRYFTASTPLYMQPIDG